MLRAVNHPCLMQFYSHWHFPDFLAREAKHPVLQQHLPRAEASKSRKPKEQHASCAGCGAYCNCISQPAASRGKQQWSTNVVRSLYFKVSAFSYQDRETWQSSHIVISLTLPCTSRSWVLPGGMQSTRLHFMPVLEPSTGSTCIAACFPHWKH